MTMTDVGAELNATVSEEDRAIIHHFLFNWENDRTTPNFRRVIKGGTEADVLKGLTSIQSNDRCNDYTPKPRRCYYKFQPYVQTSKRYYLKYAYQVIQLLRTTISSP